MTDQGKNGSGFGSCCEELKEVLEATDFDPLIAASDDGVLYMSIGMLDAEENEANVIDHPVFFCPFCGTKVQSREEVEAKTGGQDDAT
jgi:hypothetical protein